MELTRAEIIKRATRGQCPRCKCNDLFAGVFRLRETCPKCKLPLEQEDGWGLGAIPLNYSLTCVGWILPIALLYLFGLIGLKLTLALAIAGAVIIPFLTFRHSKRIWVGIYYAVLPQELKLREPGQRGDNH